MPNWRDLPGRNFGNARATLTVVSASDFRVQIPVINASSRRIVSEYQFEKQSTDVWSITNCTVKDLRGGVADIVLTEPDSVWEYAMQIGDQAEGGYPTGYDFFGCGHLNESRQSLSITVDNVEVGVASAGGVQIVITQTMNILKPAGTGAGGTIGTGTLKHTINSYGVMVSHTHTITTASLSYRTAYGAMMPVSNTKFNRSQAGSDTAIAFTGSNTITDTGQTDTTYKVYHTDTSVNPYQLRVTLSYGKPEFNTAFSAVAAPKGWFYDRTEYGKWYLNWVGDSVTAETVNTLRVHRQLYEVLVA